MRILFVTSTYVPSANGIAITLEKLRAEFIKKGHDVLILAPNYKDVKKEGVLYYPSIENPLIKDYPVPLAPGPNTMLELFKHKKFDIVHTQHPFHVGYFARMLARQYLAPLVFSFHTDYDQYAEKYAPFLPKVLREEFVTNRIFDFCSKADLVIANSKFMATRIRENTQGVKVALVPNGIEFTNYKKTSAINRKTLGFNKDDIVLLTVGRLGKEKNHTFLLRVLAKLPLNYKLVLVGDGPEKRNLKKLAKVQGVAKRTQFIGKVKHFLIGNYYNLADIFVFSSKTETQGLIFLEAQHFGLPIISVKSQAATEWLKSGGITVSGGANAFVKQVLNLKSTNVVSMTKAAKEFAAKFTIDAQVDKLLRQYKKLLDDY